MPTHPKGAPERVYALKEVFRDHIALSQCFPLAGKLDAIMAAREGASPAEAIYYGQGWRLPEGWTWDRLNEHRASVKAGAAIKPHMVPLCTAGGAVLWGVPIIDGQYLKHP